MRCLADTELVQFLDGSLPPEVATHLDAHLDSCERCFAMVASVLRGRSAVHRSLDALPTELGPAEDPAFPAVGRRYVVLSLIGQGGMGQVYRALDRLTGQAVALKRVAQRPARSRLPLSISTSHGHAATYVGCLEQEFRILATLRHPNIISVLDYGFDAELQPFYTMELLEGARAVLPYALSLPQATRIELLVQLLQALSYLHRRGVLHRDLKPSNLLVVTDAQGRRTLKVLDFGLSTGPGEGISRAMMGGTLAYMAPELFHDVPPSEASDLYAAGMVAYEVLGGSHPLAGSARTTTLLSKLLHQPPPLAHLPSALSDVLGRTLSKRPEERPRDAASLLAELCAALGISRPPEPPAVRDSFLVAARFVGRQAELEALTQALQAARSGRGAVIVLHGESGVGKSRLLEELRSRALPDGVLVLRGQAVQSGGIAYQLWRDALRLLALYVELADHEAGPLSAIVPDLPSLLARQVARSAQIEPQGTSFRLLRVLLDVFERIASPTLVLLEDLQWADPESLQLLSRLGERVAHHPILIVGSYREEEATKSLEELPVTRRLRLPRLETQAMVDLCESILGPIAQSPQVLELIARETEGNTYFLIEWVRALADEAGVPERLGQIAARWLLGGILPGGVAEVLTRRLMRVPAEAQPMLRLAAIAGRQLDLAFLRHGTPQLDALIQATAEVGVLELHAGDWRFSHDKLRERLLSELDDVGRRELHLRVARGLQAVYKDDDAHAHAIALHYQHGGDVPSAAFHYARAGGAAFARGAPGEAEGHFAQAIAHQDRIVVSRLARVQAWSGLAQARYAQGKLQETFAALQPMFVLASAPLPTDARQLAVDLLREIWRFSNRRLRGYLHLQPPHLDGEERQIQDALRKALSILEVFVWMARPDIFLACLLRGLNLEESLDTPLLERQLSYGLPFLLSHTPLRPAVQRWLQRPENQPKELVGQPAVSYLRMVAMIWLNAGSAEAAARIASDAVAVARELRDDHQIILGLLQLQLAEGSRENYDRVLAISQEMEQLSSRIQNRRYLAIGLLGQGLSWIRRGDFDRATAVLERARAAIPPEFGILPMSMVVGQLALCALRRGDASQAEAYADSTMAAVEKIGWVLLPLLHPLANALEVYLSLGSRQAHHDKIRDAMRRLEWIGWNFPYARPRALFYRGRYEAWLGNPLRARIFFEACVHFAQKRRLKYEEAEAHEWLSRLGDFPGGRLWKAGSAEAHRRAAQGLYERAGAPIDAARMAGGAAGRDSFRVK